jgi:hypothetical protein
MVMLCDKVHELSCHSVYVSGIPLAGQLLCVVLAWLPLIQLFTSRASCLWQVPSTDLYDFLPGHQQHLVAIAG